MIIPTYEEIMLPLLEVIYDRRIYTNKECEQELSKNFKLTEEELNNRLSSGKKTFYDRLNWAKTYLKNAGLIQSVEKRGMFNITKDGRTLVESKPNHIDSKYLKKYPSFVEYLERSSKKKLSSKLDDEGTETIQVVKDIKTPLEELEASYTAINESLRDELLEKLKEVDFYKFENIVVDLIIRMGYGGSKEEVKKSLTKRGSDEGIDGIINEDRLGLDRIYVQAKRWKGNNVSRPEVQKFAGALDGQGAIKGIFITTSNFTKEAMEFSNNLYNKKIILIDGYKLAALMIEFNVGISIEVIYEIKRIDSDYFLDE
ncbi:restriction endonuclease [Terrisporobacter sp.]